MTCVSLSSLETLVNNWLVITISVSLNPFQCMNGLVFGKFCIWRFIFSHVCLGLFQSIYWCFFTQLIIPNNMHPFYHSTKLNFLNYESQKKKNAKINICTDPLYEGLIWYGQFYKDNFFSTSCVHYLSSTILNA